MNFKKKILKEDIIKKCKWGRLDQELVHLRNKEKHKDEED